MTKDEEMENMMWQQEMTRKLVMGKNVIILHGNTQDYVKDSKGDYITLSQHLVREYFEQRLVIFYSISTGIQFPDEEMDRLFREQYMQNNQSQQSQTAKPTARAAQQVQTGMAQEAPLDQLIGSTPDTVLPFLAKIMKHSILVSDLDEEMAKKMKVFGKSVLKKTLIISYAQNVVPADSAHRNFQDRVIVETLERLSRDQEMNAAGNSIVMIANNLYDIAEPLRSVQADIPAIRIPKPDLEERTKLWESLISQNRIQLENGITARILGLNTNGLSIWQIRQMYAEAECFNVPLGLSKVREEKRNILEKEFGDKIKIKTPQYGFDYFGGKENVKLYFLEVRDNMENGKLRRVPMGIFLAGPPGTGKTFFCECFAHECMGFNYVQIRNPRNMYVGESERIMLGILDIIRDLAPVVVIEDETDQSEGNRDAYNGDSGVSNRQRQAKFDFCSDPTIRGKVVWIRISNRRDLVDAAYMRKGRTDEIIPFLPPDETEYAEIFKVMFARYEIPTDIGNFKTFVKSVLEKGYATGADIEWMVLEADKIAGREKLDTVSEKHLLQAIDNWEQSEDQDEIARQVILAIKGSSKTLRPKNWTLILKRAEEQLNGVRPKILAQTIHQDFKNIIPS